MIINNYVGVTIIVSPGRSIALGLKSHFNSYLLFIRLTPCTQTHRRAKKIPSLDLRQNPLMHSLGKLIDGRGRGVVHQLVPQLRILDGNHLSGRGCDLAVDAQLLNEADDLICEGASRARAAWAEEDAAAEMAAENRWEREAVDGRSSPGSPSAASLRGRRRGVVVAAAVGVDGGGLQRQTTDRGMVHWDSDLTQGGRQALFGNPRCVQHCFNKNVGQVLAISNGRRIGVIRPSKLFSATRGNVRYTWYTPAINL